MTDTARFVLKVTLFLGGILAIGTTGYYLLEDGWSLLDALYMSVITITTVGFGETHELSDGGRIFTVLLIFGGVGIVGLVGSHAARMLIDTQMKLVLGRGKMAKALERISGHYIVCGYGRIGSTICAELERLKHKFVVIECKEELVKQCEANRFLVAKGNATTDAALVVAGIERAVGVIAALSEDADNLFISLAARELNPKILIISRAEQHGVEDRMLRAGADKVVSPLVLGGRQIARLITERDGDNPLDNSSEASSVAGFALQEVQHTAADGKTVADVVGDSGAHVAVAIKRNDGATVLNPGSDKVLNQFDSLVVCFKNEDGRQQKEETPTTGRRILLVDDHRALRMLFAKKLRSAGHETIVASSGEEAIEMASESKPELIVLDVQMPGKDGYETCRIMKRMPELQGSRVLLYSADETPEFHIRGKEVGADKCLRKGSKSSELLAMIEELLEAA